MGRRETVEGSPKDHRKIAEGLLNYGLKIRKLRLFVGDLRNALVFRGYVIAIKKAPRRHQEPTKKGEGMWECVNSEMRLLHKVAGRVSNGAGRMWECANVLVNV